MIYLEPAFLIFIFAILFLVHILKIKIENVLFFANCIFFLYFLKVDLIIFLVLATVLLLLPTLIKYLSSTLLLVVWIVFSLSLITYFFIYKISPIPTVPFLGYSFLMFQVLGLTISFASIRQKKELNFKTLVNCFLFFPCILAGPFLKTESIQENLYSCKSAHEINWKKVIYLYLLGAFKKTISTLFLIYLIKGQKNSFNLSFYNSISYLISSIGYIYCDFSGYSDIANALTLSLGLKEYLNFKTPFYSTTFREFWRRWHISLGDWFQNYFFNPIVFFLRNKYAINFLIPFATLMTMFVIALWHGANFKYIIWGLANAVFILASSYQLRFLGNTLSRIFTLYLLSCLFMFFLQDSLLESYHSLRQIHANLLHFHLQPTHNELLTLILCIFGVYLPHRFESTAINSDLKTSSFNYVFLIFIFLTLTIFCGRGGETFIYSNF